MKTIKKKRKAVNDYLAYLIQDGYTLEPLMFSRSWTIEHGYTGLKRPRNYRSLSIDKLVMYTLYQNARHNSILSSNSQVETSFGKRRSVIDIWRHVAYMNNSIDIFDVMESLYRQREKLKITYCSVILRTTFLIKDPRPSFVLPPIREDDNIMSEFKIGIVPLIFQDWKNLH